MFFLAAFSAFFEFSSFLSFCATTSSTFFVCCIRFWPVITLVKTFLESKRSLYLVWIFTITFWLTCASLHFFLMDLEGWMYIKFTIAWIFMDWCLCCEVLNRSCSHRLKISRCFSDPLKYRITTFHHTKYSCSVFDWFCEFYFEFKRFTLCTSFIWLFNLLNFFGQWHG